MALALLALRASLSEDSFILLSRTVWLCFSGSLFCGAALMLCRWRFVGDPESAWMAALLLLLGLYLQPYPQAAASEGPIGRLSPIDLIAIAIAIWITRSGSKAEKPTHWRHPLVAGTGAGVVLSALWFVWSTVDSPLPGTAAVVVILVCYALGSVICIRAILAMEAFSLEARILFVVALNTGVAAHHFAPAGSPVQAEAVVATAVCAWSALLLLVNAIDLLQEAYVNHSGHLLELADRANRAEELVHREQEMRHEFRATVAGINSASRLLIGSTTRISQPRADSLRQMLEAEMCRLESMLAADPANGAVAAERLDLDEVIEPVIVAQRTQGADIDYARADLVAYGARDEVATAVNVLLANVRRHAPGAKVQVTYEMQESHVLLRVADDGPGIPDELRRQLFRRCAKGPNSPGEGLGLFSARRAMRHHGGDLRLEPSTHGAVFSMVIPR